MLMDEAPADKPHFCLVVDDLDGLRRRLEEAGVETRDPTPLVGRPRFTCRDPFGNMVELAQSMTDASSASTSARPASRASRSTPDGERAREAEEDYPLSTPQPGWAEQDPEDWWRAAEAVRARLPDGPIGLSGQMHGLVVLGDGRARCCGPAILWNDQRTGAECAEIEARVGLDRLIALTGNRALAGFTAPKLLWLRRHEPETLRADPPRAAAEGLRPAPADRRARDRRRRRLGDAALRRRRPALVGGGLRRARGAARVAAAGVRVDRDRGRGRPGGRPRSASASTGPGPSRSCSARRASSSPRCPAYAPDPRGARARLLPRRARARGTRWA